MKILSRNVNGIRAVAKKGFVEWVTQENPDVLCLQETKAFQHQISAELLSLGGYRCLWHEWQRPWYAGTAIYTRHEPVSQMSSFEQEMFYEDGRVTQVEYQGYTIINVYFPNGNPRADGSEMLPYKLSFYDQMIAYMDTLVSQGKKVVLVGDLNICHTEIDIARPEANKNSIGFLPVERQKITEFLSHGYVDVFRSFEPEMIDEYTWWSYRWGARSRNVWRRLDYAVVDHDTLPYVESFAHRQDVMGSDHCPVEVIMKDL